MNSLPREYGPLVRELLKRAADKRQPVYGTFELTERCNLTCRMCYIRQPAGDSAFKKKELSAADWLKIAREAMDQGMVFLLLTGGEPLLRQDFFDILEPLTRMGLMISLFTNGTLITDAIAQRLSQSPPSRMEITLYGATAPTYEAVSGVRGSYAHCLAGIEALVKRHLPLGLKTTITKQNVHELEAMRQIAHSWGVPFSASGPLLKRSDGHASDVENCRLSAEEFVALEATDSLCAEAWSKVTTHASLNSNYDNFHCQAGKGVFVIGQSGNMKVCINLPFPAVHPLETGFSTAWKEIQRYVDDAPPRAPICFACEARDYCPQCPAWSYIETGTLTEPVPYLCEIAYRRKDLYQRSA